MSWAAVAAAGVTVAGTVATSLATQKGAEGTNANVPKYKGTFTEINNVQAPDFGNMVTETGQNLLELYPFLQDVANQATANQTRQREKIMPGSKAIMRQGSNVIQSYLRGQIPQDVQDQTQRAVAESLGGGWNAATQGGQAGANFARNIGQTSLGIQQMGLSAAPTWQSLADSFVVRPTEYAGIATNLLGQMANQQYQYDALNTDINMFNESSRSAQKQSQYNAGMDQYQAGQIANNTRAQYGAAMGQQIGALGGTIGQLGAAYAGSQSSIPRATAASPVLYGQPGGQSPYRNTAGQLKDIYR